MEHQIENLHQCPLFTGIVPADLSRLLPCLSATFQNYEKNDFIFLMDEKPIFIGVVISGSVHVIQEDYWGNRVILAHINANGLFGEAFSCAEADRLPVSVVAAEQSEIMLVDYRRIITTCPNTCVFHGNMIRNMVKILASKNIYLTRKIDHMSKRTIRERLLAFLSDQSARAGTNQFQIPYNRQELADYLCVDRSALSRELSGMQKEGILEYKGRMFQLPDSGTDS